MPLLLTVVTRQTSMFLLLTRFDWGGPSHIKRGVCGAPSLFIDDTRYDLRMGECRGGTTCQDGGSHDLIGGRQSIEEDKTKLDVSDTHGHVGEGDAGLIQLGKLSGHCHIVIESGLHELYP